MTPHLRRTLMNNSFFQNFANPPQLCSPAYFWYMNDKMDVDVLIHQLHEMAAHGLKAVCFHPLPKAFRPITMDTRMDPDYLTPEYFAVVADVVAECKRLGMHFWLYDEGGWPSGSACGQVSAVDPEGFCGWTLKHTPEGAKPVKNKPDNAPGTPNYPDLLNRKVTDTFIRLTHEQYFKTFPDAFGSTIRLAFQDEARLGTKMSWAEDLTQQFQQRKGYSVEPFYEALANDPKDDDPEDVIQARIDASDVRSQFFAERFLEPIQDWCHDHGILSSGHFNGEDDPALNVIFGHVLRSMRRLDVPGIDVIWRQIFIDKDTPLFPKYASSIARQNGRQIAMSETGAVFGNGLTPQHFKWLIDYQLVRGINMFVLSAFPNTTREHYLYSLPRPFCGPTDPLWNYSDSLHSHISRSCAILSSGKSLCTTAVYYDVPSIWSGASRQTEAVRIHNAIGSTLLQNQCDFDFFDDDALLKARCISSEGRPPRLAIGEMEYDTFVVPAVNRMTKSAQSILQSFKDMGGKVINENDLSTIVPVVELLPESPHIRATARRLPNDEEVYFIVNESSSTVCTRIRFPQSLHKNGKSPWLMNTLDGTFSKLPTLNDNGIDWTFQPLSSFFVFFGNPPQNQIAQTPVPPPVKETIELTDGWKLSPKDRFVIGENGVQSIPQNDQEKSVLLGDWRCYVDDSFSGNAVYSCTFDNAHKARNAFLSLGDVRYCCQVILNGQPLTKLAWAPYECDLTPALTEGTNKLEIVVTNTLANAIADPVLFAEWKHKYAARHDHYDSKERASELDSLPSGLFGPVVISFQ